MIKTGTRGHIRIADFLKRENSQSFEYQYYTVRTCIEEGYLREKDWKERYFYEAEGIKAGVFPVDESLVKQMIAERKFSTPPLIKPNFIVSSLGYFLLLRHQENLFKMHAPVTKFKPKGKKYRTTPKVFAVEFLPKLKVSDLTYLGKNGFMKASKSPHAIEGGHFSFISIDHTNKEVMDRLSVSAFENFIMDINGLDGRTDVSFLSNLDVRNDALEVFSYLPQTYSWSPSMPTK
jgi:hypothetical protein